MGIHRIDNGGSMKSLEFYLKTHCKGKENAVKSPDLEAIFYCKGRLIEG